MIQKLYTKKTFGKTATFRESHGEKQEDYLLWKYEILKNLCNVKPKLYKNGNYKAYRLGSKLLPFFKELHNLWYNDRKNMFNKWMHWVWPFGFLTMAHQHTHQYDKYHLCHLL